MGTVTEILFSFVREAMGNERVTTCSPTAGGRHPDKEQGLEDPQNSPGNREKLKPSRRVCVCVRVSSLTQWVRGRALEDEPVGGEEDGALSREQRRTSHQPRGLLTAVRDQVDPHAIHHQLLAGQQCRPQ